jgi:hypothetical protein
VKTYNVEKERHFVDLRKLNKLAAFCISALFIISILSALQLPGVQAATTGISVGRVTYATSVYTSAQTAKYFDAWIGHWDAVTRLAVPAKALNPNLKAFLYCNTLLRYAGTYGVNQYNDPPGSFDTFKKNGWLLKDTKGNYVIASRSGSTIYYVDFGNSAVWAWYANWLGGIVTANNLNGVVLDNVFYNSAVWWYTSQTAINPRTGTTWTSSAVLNAYIGFTKAVTTKLGSGKIVLANGIYDGQSNQFNSGTIQTYIAQSGVDAFISEGWLGNPYSLSWQTEAQWINSVNMAVWVQKNLLAVNGQGAFLPICACASTNPNMKGTLNGLASSNQYTTFAYASLLMAATYNGNHLFLGTVDTYSQGLFKINIGTPTGSYGIVSGTHVYSRSFSSGKVLVNPTATSYQVNVGSGFTNAATGASVSSTVTVPAHSGLILKR